MIKNEIKIQFHSKMSEEAIRQIVTLLEKKYVVKITDEYDYYFAMETIYYSIDNMRELVESRKEAIRIMFCGEAIYPDMNLFDYAVCYWDEYIVEDRIIYMPFLEMIKGSVYNNIEELDNSKKGLDAENILKSKNKFCNFLYGNPLSHPMRDNIFYKLSEYKWVDSLGSHLNNVEIENTRNDKNWAKLSIALKGNYKFSIAAENARFVGYTSEKLVTSMMANTIPIYWGNPHVGKWFNEKSFINIMSYDSLDLAIEHIKEIDSNDSLYIEMMNQPWRTDTQINNAYRQIKTAYEKFYSIFDDKEIVRPRGCWPDYLYSDFFVSDYKKKTFYEKIKQVIRRFGVK